MHTTAKLHIRTYMCIGDIGSICGGVIDAHACDMSKIILILFQIKQYLASNSSIF